MGGAPFAAEDLGFGGNGEKVWKPRDELVKLGLKWLLEVESVAQRAGALRGLELAQPGVRDLTQRLRDQRQCLERGNAVRVVRAYRLQHGLWEAQEMADLLVVVVGG